MNEPPELWKHVKTGGVYRWLMSAVREDDGTVCVVYQCIETGVRWIRPSKEFHDGRFVRQAASLPVDGMLRATLEAPAK